LNNKKALLIQMVITLTMAIKRLLSSRNCGHCDEAKRILQNEINNGEIEVIDIDSNRDIIWRRSNIIGRKRWRIARTSFNSTKR